jgi:hypothetical protein
MIGRKGFICSRKGVIVLTKKFKQGSYLMEKGC